MLGILGPPGGAKLRCDPVGRDANLLHVVMPVEKVSVNPPAPVIEQTAAFGSERSITHGARHLLTATQCAQIGAAAKRVGTIELDVVSVVLHTFEDAVAVRVPASIDPGEFQRLPDLRPDPQQPVAIAAKLPVDEGLDDLPHGF